VEIQEHPLHMQIQVQQEMIHLFQQLHQQVAVEVGLMEVQVI